MKNYFRLIYAFVLTIFSIAEARSQCQNCHERNSQIKDNSTNPLDPENCEWDIISTSASKPNIFRNSFNWGANSGGVGSVIELNSQAGWDLASSSGFYTVGSFLMTSPYNYGYLYIPGANFNDLDWHWEDGWELLKVDFGSLQNTSTSFLKLQT